MEIREVSNPKFIHVWLLNVIDNSKEYSNEIVIEKKIRDVVMWNKALKPWRRSGAWFCIKGMFHYYLCVNYGKEKGNIWSVFNIWNHLTCHMCFLLLSQLKTRKLVKLTGFIALQNLLPEM